MVSIFGSLVTKWEEVLPGWQLVTIMPFIWAVFTNVTTKVIFWVLWTDQASAFACSGAFVIRGIAFWRFVSRLVFWWLPELKLAVAKLVLADLSACQAEPSAFIN